MKNLVALIVALACIAAAPASAQENYGSVYIDHQPVNGGVQLTGPGDGGFNYGGNYNHYVTTPIGQSNLSGQFGANGNVYVPKGSDGTANASYQMYGNGNAAHGFIPATKFSPAQSWANTSGNFTMNLNSSSSGNGNSSVQGNISFNPSSSLNFVPPPAIPTSLRATR
ncbi:MAG: hypothetical protein WC217_03250 [Candidatus Paceibacterota bacterium]|jgi:hypothetical protein